MHAPEVACFGRNGRLRRAAQPAAASGLSDGQEEGGDEDENERETSRNPQQTEFFHERFHSGQRPVTTASDGYIDRGGC